MAALPELIDAYLHGPRLLRQAVDGMSREQLRARPVPGKWSTLEVICHLCDFEPIYAVRMKRVLSYEKPPLLAADDKKFAAVLTYHERDAEEELSIIELTRQQMARILRVQKPEALARVGIHSEAGPRTLEQLLMSVTDHIPHHVKFIQEKRRALGI